MFIMIDGLDGSGKSTIINAIKENITNNGNPVFDLKKYCIEKDDYPELLQTKAYDFIFSCEPSYAPMGKIIRNELINSHKNYSPLAIAHSYSLDRLILYKNLIIPLLEQNKCIIQDRGVSTSLAYQSLHTGNITIDEIAALPGNQLALQHSPDHLIIIELDPQKALERIGGRTDKQDEAVFEKIEFQNKLSTIFHSKEYKDQFEQRGTQIHFLSSDAKIDIMNKRAVDLFNSLTNL